MKKSQIRNKYKELRASLSAKELEQKSLDISNQVLKLPIWDYSFYHLFLSISEKKEINTEPILHILQGKDKNIVVSRCNVNTMKLSNFLLTDNTVIKKNTWGIPEPTDGISIAANQIDVVFIPLLAYDKRGNRIGYGKGFYDGFLAECRDDVVKVGLSFFDPEPHIADIHSNDVPLDYCVTPEGIFQFGKKVN